MKEGFLILATGEVLRGQLRGDATKQPVAELVFTTGMAGCLETLTDPCYYGQMVIQTFPLIGNYGVVAEDVEYTAPALSGYIVHELCDAPSNFRSEGPLEAWLKRWGVPALAGLDTRRLTRVVRERGAINARLSHAPELTEAEWAELRGYRIRDAVRAVAGRQTEGRAGGARPRAAGEAGAPTVVLYNFGAAASTAAGLAARGCTVKAVPADTTAADALLHRPQGIVLSGGPGDPAENTAAIRQISLLFSSSVPVFGIGLGHQLMALAHGARSFKMKHGHRGVNQPVVNTETGRACITGQNHGYCVAGESLGAGARELYKNANDGTCEGVRYAGFGGFSVQFHPGEAAGPQSTRFLFDEWMTLMKEAGAHAT